MKEICRMMVFRSAMWTIFKEEQVGSLVGLCLIQRKMLNLLLSGSAKRLNRIYDVTRRLAPELT